MKQPVLDWDAAFEQMSQEQCLSYLELIQWGNMETGSISPVCPRCGTSEKIYQTGDRRHKCGACLYKFTVLVGTIFENTKLPLPIWFKALRLLRYEITSRALAKELGVKQPTAYRLKRVIYDKLLPGHRKGWVYYLRSENGLVKIGQTKNLKKRIQRHRAASSVPVTLLFTERIHDCVERERAVHRALDVFRSHGEWFRLSLHLN